MEPDPTKKKILFILGTRPEAIKFAPLIHTIRQDGHFNSVVCFTGQHKEMLHQTADFFDLKNDYDLALMVPHQTLVDFVARSLTSIYELIGKEKPDLVFVQGDTSTVFSASLAAFYNKTKIAHLEAGLRSGDKYSPFPEEINRVLSSRLADFHFAPTALAQQNLQSEGIIKNVFVVGNTVIDALFLCLKILRTKGEETYFRKFPGLDFSQKIILITCHRRENFGSPLLDILEAFKEFAIQHPSVQLVYPVHLNPQIHDVAYRYLSGVANIFLTAPLEYPSLIWLMNRSHFVVTDSGGIQEEAPSLGKPVLVLREVTERVESVEAGSAILVGSDKQKIAFEMNRLCEDEDYYLSFKKNQNAYGDGTASQKILAILKAHL